MKKEQMTLAQVNKTFGSGVEHVVNIQSKKFPHVKINTIVRLVLESRERIVEEELEELVIKAELAAAVTISDLNDIKIPDLNDVKITEFSKLRLTRILQLEDGKEESPEDIIEQALEIYRRHRERKVSNAKREVA